MNNYDISFLFVFTSELYPNIIILIYQVKLRKYRRMLEVQSP